MRTHRTLALAVTCSALLGAGGVALAQTPAATTLGSQIGGGAPVDPAKPGYVGLTNVAGQKQYLRELGSARAQPQRTTRRTSLTYFAQLNDFQLSDEESPARIDSLAPVQRNTSAQRPQEALVPFTVDAAIRRLNAFTAASPNRGAKGRRARMDLALLGGDQADNQQENETTWVRQLVEGGQTLNPNSGVADTTSCTPEQRAALAQRPADEAARYTGLQDYADYNDGAGDGNFYDPNRPSGVYAQWPQYQNLMDAAQRPFMPVGLRRGSVPVPTYVTNGNHDGELQGYLRGTPAGQKVATGCFKPYVQNPSGGLGAYDVFSQPNGFAVPPDPRRRLIDRTELKHVFASGAQRDAHGFAFVDPAQGQASANTASYYSWVPKPGVRFVSLDTVSEGTGVLGGAEGNLDDPQFQWLRGELAKAKAAKQVVVVFGHHPIRRLIATTPDETAGACSAPATGCDSDPRNSSPIRLRADVEKLFNANPNVVAYLSGHTHVNRIRPCATTCKGKANWWSVETVSSTDWPQQQRLIEVMDNHDGTLSILGTQVDQAGPTTSPGPADASAFGVDQLASLSRTFSYNDPRAVRNAAGGKGDRNVELMVRDPRAGAGAGLCTGVTTTVSGRTVNRATLNRARSTVRRAFTAYALKSKTSTLDRYCTVGGGYLRVGYTRNRSVIALTSSKVNRLARLAVGSRVKTVRRRLRGERAYRVGASTVYLARGSKARVLVEVRRGKVRQLGLADSRATATKKKAAALLKTFL